MRAALSLLLPVALVLAGCGAKAQQIGGELRRKAPPSVVSLSPSTSEVVGTSFDVRQLVGRTAADNYPTSVISVPVVAEVKPDFEKIKGIAPGLILYDADLYNPSDIKRFESMGIKTLAMKAHTIKDFEKELFTLALELGSETTVSSYVDRIEIARSAADGAKITPSPKVVVMLAGGSGSYYVAGINSFVADVVKTVGGTPVGPVSDKFASMNAEALVAAAPDMIVLATSKEYGGKDFATIKADPRLKTLPAVQKNKIVALDQDVVLRRGGRVNAFIQDLHHELSLLSQK